MTNSVVHSSLFLHEGAASLEISRPVIVMVDQNNLKLCDRFIQAVGLEQKFTEVEMGNVIPASHCKCPTQSLSLSCQ